MVSKANFVLFPLVNKKKSLLRRVYFCGKNDDTDDNIPHWSLLSSILCPELNH